MKGKKQILARSSTYKRLETDHKRSAIPGNINQGYLNANEKIEIGFPNKTMNEH